MLDKIIGYRIVPIKAGENAGMVMTAALNTCFVTGKLISSMGGGMSLNVAPEVVEVLKNDEAVQEFIRERIALLGSHPVG